MRISNDTAAVVTGGASGLGLATARALAAAGARVAIFDMNREAGEAVAAELGGIFCEVNVTSEEMVVAGFELARAAHGQEAILVNCAGDGRGSRPPPATAPPGRSGATRPRISTGSCRST